MIDNVIIGLEFEKSKFFGKLFGKAKKAYEKASEILKAVGLEDSKNNTVARRASITPIML